MEINTDIWGLPSSWVNGTTTETNADIKYPETTKNTYRKQYNSGGIPWNSIDLSPAFWGIGKGSILCQPHYLSAHTPNGELNNIEVTTERVFEPLDKPLIFLQAYNTSFYSTFRYNNRYRYIDGEHQTTSYPSGRMYTDKVMMSFNYQKVMAFGFVKRVANLTASPFFTELQELIDNYDSYIGQYLTGFTYGVRFGEGGDTNRTSAATGCFLPFIPFEIPGKSISYNNLSFYATAEGMAIPPMSSTSGNATIPLGIGNINDAKGDAMVGDSTTGFAYRYCKGASTDVPLYYYDDTNPLWTIEKSTRVVSSSQTNWLYAPVIKITAENKDNIINYILSQMAYIGLPFTTSSDRAARGKIGDTGVYLPKFDDSGITTGQYEEGINALRLPNAEWTDGREGARYDPAKHKNDDYGYLFNPFNSNRFTTGLNVWCMYQQDILDVLAGINNLYLTDPDGNEKWQLDFKGSNPDDYIVSCKAMLLDVSHTSNTFAFTLGPVQFDGIGCYKYNGTGYFSFGTIPLDGTEEYSPYGDFRDYQPYTTMELYIPLCGTVEIDPEFFVGHSIEIIMMYDIYTGACTAGIYRDNYTLWKAVNGQIGADIPVSALQMGTYQNAIHSLQAAQKQNEIRLASSAVTVAAGAAALIASPATGGTSLIAGAGLISGAAGLLSGVMQEQNYDYQIEHTQPLPAQTTAAETQNNFCIGGLYPVLYVKRAKELEGYDAKIYSHTVGNACLINGCVGSQTGLVMCSSVDLTGVPATVEEINAIKQALGKGVYV